jgi:hypothetical protein
MVKYSYTLQHIPLNMNDSFRITINIIIFASLYAFSGALISYGMYYLFDVYGSDWIQKGFAFQIFDIFVEISMIAVASFWVNYVFNEYLPIFPVKSHLVDFVNSYTVGLFFMFVIFLFLNDLNDKIIYIHDYFLKEYFDYIFPAEGSILDLSLRYSEEQRKKIDNQKRK